MFCFGTEIGTENRGFSLVLVPNTEILVPWQPYCTVLWTVMICTQSCSRDFMTAVFNISVSSVFTWMIFNRFWRNFTEVADTNCIHCEIWQNCPPHLYLYLYKKFLRVALSREHNCTVSHLTDSNVSEEMWLKQPTQIAYIVKYDKTTPPIYIYIYIKNSWELHCPMNILYSVTLDGFQTFLKKLAHTNCIHCEIHVKMKTYGLTSLVSIHFVIYIDS